MAKFFITVRKLITIKKNIEADNYSEAMQIANSYANIVGEGLITGERSEIMIGAAEYGQS